MTISYFFSPSFLDESVPPPPDSASSNTRGEADATADERSITESLRAHDVQRAQHALQQLIAAYEHRLVRFAFSLVRSIDVAEDIVQDVLVRVWEGRHTLEPAQSIRAYCFTAVRRRALDVLKHRDVHARYTAEVVATSIPAALTVDEQLDIESVTRAVRQAIAQLPERRRTALTLRFDEMLPFAQIAAVMGTTEKAAKDLVARAVREIRNQLGL